MEQKMLFDRKAGGNDPAYTALRDREDLKPNRDAVELLWKKFEPYSDKHFKREFRDKFASRYWEMYLGCSLLDQGKKLKKKPAKGPDFAVAMEDGRTCWLEAVAPEEGSTIDAVPEMGNGGWQPIDKILLRIRSAISVKYQMYREYITDRVVGENDPFLIGVNLNKVEFAIGDVDPPFIIQAVFPIGGLAVEFDTKTLGVVGQEYSHKPSVTKVSGVQIPTNIFLDPEYEGISAVLYSTVNAGRYSGQQEHDYKVVYNPMARNPLSSKWLTCSSIYWVENNRIKSRLGT